MSFDLPEEPSHSPVFPKMPSYTSDKHTLLILPFIFTSESKPPPPPQPPATAGPDSSSPLLMDSCLHQLNRLPKSGREHEGIYLARVRLDKKKGCDKGNMAAERIRIISIIIAKKINRGLLKPSASCCRPSRAGHDQNFLPPLPLRLPPPPPPPAFPSSPWSLL